MTATANPGLDALVARMVELQRDLHDKVPPPVRRAQHPHPHGLARGELVVNDKLDNDLRHGVFARPGARFDAWVRFSNGRGDDDRVGTMRGAAVKLVGIDQLVRPDQDFLFVDHPVFFVKDLAEYVQFFDALAALKLRRLTHAAAVLRPAFAKVMWRRRAVLKVRGNVQSIAYFSGTPYRLGPHAVKWALRPRPENGPEPAPADTDNFLRVRLAKHLESKPLAFELAVLVQTDPARMPVDDPTVDWETAAGPGAWRTVATLTLPPQVPDSPERLELADTMAFTPWNTLTAHEPLGDINFARRAVYEALSHDRLSANGRGAPVVPGPAAG